MIEVKEVISVRLPYSLIAKVKLACDQAPVRKGQKQLLFSEFVRLALERELANRKRSKEYRARRRAPLAPGGEEAPTPLMPDPKI